MITQLHISNFKSHKDTHINLGNLTVLTGVNGCGKTSIVQSLLLLRQSFLKNRLAQGLDLNHPLCSIGIAHDALYRLAEDDIITFHFTADLNEYHFSFKAEMTNLQDSFIRKNVYNDNACNDTKLRDLPLFNNDFQYISAARWGGKSIFPKETYAVEIQKQLSLNEGQGELVAHFLDKYGAETVQDYYEESLKEDLSLLQQTIYWEQKISPDVTINVEQRKDSSTYAISYGFNGEDSQTKPVMDLRAENIGYGISYTLPVIVALLSAQPGALVILENPEAHLHPGGQAALAKLIAKVASKGIQVIVETHSDHIINGILLACKAYQKNHKQGISNHLVKVYDFHDKEKHASKAEEVVINEDGTLRYQPKGFFDQAENDLYSLYNE